MSKRLIQFGFLSTLSLRRATRRHRGNNRRPVHFYPRSPCGERQPYLDNKPTQRAISIHALLAESDRRRTYQPDAKRAFLSTLSLRRATLGRNDCDKSWPFLSTLSLRRATKNSVEVRMICTDFYPRSPCGERQLCACPAGSAYLFLSTLSLRRATKNSVEVRMICTDFYPRSPCGERPDPSAE